MSVYDIRLSPAPYLLGIALGVAFMAAVFYDAKNQPQNAPAANCYQDMAPRR
jgi:hypothetical protein